MRIAPAQAILGSQTSHSHQILSPDIRPDMAGFWSAGHLGDFNAGIIYPLRDQIPNEQMKKISWNGGAPFTDHPQIPMERGRSSSGCCRRTGQPAFDGSGECNSACSKLGARERERDEALCWRGTSGFPREMRRPISWLLASMRVASPGPDWTSMMKLLRPSAGEKLHMHINTEYKSMTTHHT